MAAEVTSTRLALLLGAKHTAGFFVPGQFCPDADSFLPYPVEENEVWRHLRLIELLGVPLQGDHLEFPVYQGDYDRLHVLPAADSLRPGEFVCVHAGAKFPSRRWPAKKFAAVARQPANEGLQIVLTGVASEQPLIEDLTAELDVPYINLAGQTDLGSFAALVNQACLVISNDTGISHLAAALRVPSIVIVLGSDSRRWGPSDRRRHRVLQQPIECRPCEYEVCPIGFGCAEGVSVNDVLGAARDLLREFSPLHFEGRHSAMVSNSLACPSI